MVGPRLDSALRSVLVTALTLVLGCARQGASPVQQATLLADKGRHEDAAALLQRHLVEHPDAIAERRLLIRIVALTGRMDMVEREVARLAQRLKPNDPTPWIELGHAFELNHEYERALSMFDRAGELSPSDPAGPLTGGLRAARWGEVELALPRLEEALRRDPSNSKAWHALGLVRLHLGDTSGAKIAYESGLQANPKSIENRIGLATLALSLDEPQQALAQYDAILADRPDFADAHLGRSFALIKLGRFPEARDTLEIGYRLGANRSVVARQRALLDRLEARR